MAATSAQATVANHLTKADLSGAEVCVAQSRCPSQVGHSGLVVMETANMLSVVTRADRLLKLPKADCLFTFRIGDRYLVTVHGANFTYAPYVRATRRHKPRAMVNMGV